MKKVFLLGSVLFCLIFPAVGQAVEAAPRITDKEIIERLTRLEEGQKALGQRVDELTQDMGQRLEALRQLVLWGFGMVFAGIFALVGFVIWDHLEAN